MHDRLRIEPRDLLNAYCIGAFPMAMDDGSLGWFSPDPRGVIPLESFHIPHGLKRTLKKALFEIRINSAFADVIRECGSRKETWIDETIIASYQQLHSMGFAHSVEAWQEGELVGGLYGVSIAGAFFGESMFSKKTDASKVALVSLVRRLRRRNFTLLDTQWSTPHLKSFGCIDISKKYYMEKLAQALAQNVKFV